MCCASSWSPQAQALPACKCAPVSLKRTAAAGYVWVHHRSSRANLACSLACSLARSRQLPVNKLRPPRFAHECTFSHADHAQEAAALWQVDVAVVTKTVIISHRPALISKQAMIATLNHAQLDASPQAPREQIKTKGRYIPPWNGAWLPACICAQSSDQRLTVSEQRHRRRHGHACIFLCLA